MFVSAGRRPNATNIRKPVQLVLSHGAGRSARENPLKGAKTDKIIGELKAASTLTDDPGGATAELFELDGT